MRTLCPHITFHSFLAPHLCVPKIVVSFHLSRAMSLAPHRTPSTSSSTFSLFQVSKRLLTSGISCADPRERGRDGYTLIQNLSHNLTDHRHHDSKKEITVASKTSTRPLTQTSRRKSRKEPDVVRGIVKNGASKPLTTRAAWTARELKQPGYLKCITSSHAKWNMVQTQTVEVVIAGHKGDTEPQVIVLEAPKEQFR